MIRIVLRAAGLLFGVIVLGLIADKLFVDEIGGLKLSERSCLFDNKKAACEFGLACGALALLIALIFIVLDLLVDGTGNLKEQRKPVLAASCGLSVFMAILWLACFIYLTKLWSDVNGNDFRDEYKNAGQATLAFSFLSIPVWIALAVFSFISLQAVAPA